MKNCGALVSPSTYCCSTFPCQGSRLWRTATSDVTLFGAAWRPQLVSLTCCLDGIDGRLGRAAFQGSKLCFNFFCFCVCTPRTHTRLCVQFVLINLYTRWYLVIKSIGCTKCRDRLSGNEKHKSGQLGNQLGHKRVYPPNIETYSSNNVYISHFRAHMSCNHPHFGLI